MSDIVHFADQDIFAKAVFEQKHSIFIYVGSIRSGKTIICLNILNALCLIYPGSRWAVIRHDGPTLEKTTLPSYMKYCYLANAVQGYSKGQQTVTFKNGSQILFMAESFDIDPDLNRFKGLEVNGFLLEQIEELQEKTYQIAITRSGQWSLDPMPPSIIMANANPSQNWIKTKFYDPWRAGIHSSNLYLQIADIHKNPYIGQAYLDLLKTELTPEMYARFVDGNWDATDEIGQLISWEQIHAAKARIDTPSRTRYLGVDVGRNGPDPSVWIEICGDNIEQIEAIGKTSIPEVARHTEQWMLEKRIDAENVVIDSVGLGGGVVDILAEKGLGVVAFVGGAGTDESLTGTNFKFKNHRSLACWKTAEAIKGGKLGNITNQILISDMGAIRYEIKGDKQIYIEAKEEFKSRTGRSSDYWDALYMAHWARVRQELMPVPGFFVLK